MICFNYRLTMESWQIYLFKRLIRVYLLYIMSRIKISSLLRWWMYIWVMCCNIWLAFKLIAQLLTMLGSSSNAKWINSLVALIVWIRLRSNSISFLSWVRLTSFLHIAFTLNIVIHTQVIYLLRRDFWNFNFTTLWLGFWLTFSFTFRVRPFRITWIILMNKLFKFIYLFKNFLFCFL
jgi:hypothetical protein